MTTPLYPGDLHAAHMTKVAKLIPAFSVDQATDLIEGFMKLGELKAGGRLPLAEFKDLHLRALRILTGQANNAITIEDITKIVNEALEAHVALRKS